MTFKLKMKILQLLFNLQNLKVQTNKILKKNLQIFLPGLSWISLSTKNARISVLPPPSEFRQQITGLQPMQAVIFTMLHNFQILGKNG